MHAGYRGGSRGMFSLINKLAGKVRFRVRTIGRLWDVVVAAADSACGERGGGSMSGWPAAEPRSFVV
jgi:hypothetical protein